MSGIKSKFLLVIALALYSSCLTAQERFKEFAEHYNLASFMSPKVLEADFSGDRVDDLAVLVERKSDNKKGILILFGNSEDAFVVGAGNSIGPAGDDFNWAGSWTVMSDSTTFQTTFNAEGDVAGGKEVKLERAAISIRESEGSGGLIYFDGKKFTWIHQGN